MARRNYIEELRAMSVRENDGLYGALADYMNQRLITTNKTIFEYIPAIDGIREDKLHLLPLVQKLIERGFFDGD